MFVPIVLATVCLASSPVLAAYKKPFYKVEYAETLFKDFLKEYNKVYNRRDYYERLEIFKENLRDINERNAMYPDTVFAVNHFADLKPYEIQQYLGFKLPEGNITKVSIPDGPTPPKHLDWRDHHVVSHVKNQGRCGSCYIFSAVGNIEGQYAIKHKKCLALSEAQALECLHCGTCGGGLMHRVMQELAQTKKKLEKEANYPYDAADGHKRACKENLKLGAVKVKGGKQLHIKDEEELKNKLANLGPLAVALNANDLPSYHGGILEPHRCKNQYMNHGVLLVGYGEEHGKKYWLIKNSWGKKWGEKGYFRLVRGKNACRMGTSYTAHSKVV